MNKKANKYKMRDVPITFFFSDFYHRRFHCELLAATFYPTKNATLGKRADRLPVKMGLRA